MAIINQVDDADLARLVWRHPVVGVLPMWPDFDEHREVSVLGTNDFYLQFVLRLENDVSYFCLKNRVFTDLEREPVSISFMQF